ncbi:hypothetical protein GGI12_003868 [Dipsacomyces acuminosporus]|nr:hypothetical protein GGI12_003868 [Dipsacomyces acuminosporus]
MSARAIQLIVTSKVHMLSGQVERNDPQFISNVQRSLTRKFSMTSKSAQGRSRTARDDGSELDKGIYIDKLVLEEAILESKPVVDLEKRMKILAKIQKYSKWQPYVTEKAMLSYIGIAVAAVSIGTLVINAVNKQYSLVPVSVECNFIWAFVPITCVICTYLYLICPALLFMIWGMKDAYGIKTDLIVCDTVGTVNSVVMLVWQFGAHHLTLRWSGFFFIWNAVFMIHVSSVAVPLWKSMKQSKSINKKLTYDRLGESVATLVQSSSNDIVVRNKEFEKMLDDANEYAKFREFAATCFYSEMTAFIDEYQSLKAMTLLALGQEEFSTDQTRPLTNFSTTVIEGDPMDDHWEANGRLTGNINLRKLKSNATVGILKAAQEVYPNRHFGHTTPFPPAMMDKLVSIFSNYINSTSYTAIDIPPMMAKNIQDRLNTNQMYLTILDEVKEYVLNTLFTDVFTRYL